MVPVQQRGMYRLIENCRMHGVEPIAYLKDVLECLPTTTNKQAKMMVTMNNYVAGYAEAMVLGTPQHQLVNPDEPKKKAGMSSEDIARMESEMESLERDLKAVTDNYTENMLTLQTALTYTKNLLKNAKVVRYLNANHAEIYSEFETIAAAETV